MSPCREAWSSSQRSDNCLFLVCQKSSCCCCLRARSSLDKDNALVTKLGNGARTPSDGRAIAHSTWSNGVIAAQRSLSPLRVST